MTDHRDPDETQHLPADDETRAIDAEETRAIGDDDEATQAMRSPTGAHAERTRRYEEIVAPAGTYTERIYVPERTGIGNWVIAAVVAIALIAGLLLGYSNADPSDNNVVARALVSPQGGTLAFDEQGRLEIPPGALPTVTAIVVRKERIERRVRLGLEGDPDTVVYEPGGLDVYVFEPEGLQFQKPVQITLPRTNAAGGILVDSDHPHVIPGTVRGDVIVIETLSFAFDR